MSKKRFDLIERMTFIILLAFVMGVKGLNVPTTILIGVAWGLLSNIIRDTIVEEDE
jgi:hypothetical protein